LDDIAEFGRLTITDEAATPASANCISTAAAAAAVIDVYAPGGGGSSDPFSLFELSLIESSCDDVSGRYAVISGDDDDLLSETSDAVSDISSACSADVDPHTNRINVVPFLLHACATSAKPSPALGKQSSYFARGARKLRATFARKRKHGKRSNTACTELEPIPLNVTV
jgi:hypothetical protein